MAMIVVMVIVVVTVMIIMMDVCVRVPCRHGLLHCLDPRHFAGLLQLPYKLALTLLLLL